MSAKDGYLDDTNVAGTPKKNSPYKKFFFEIISGFGVAVALWLAYNAFVVNDDVAPVGQFEVTFSSTCFDSASTRPTFNTIDANKLVLNQGELQFYVDTLLVGYEFSTCVIELKEATSNVR